MPRLITLAKMENLESTDISSILRILIVDSVHALSVCLVDFFLLKELAH